MLGLGGSADHVLLEFPYRGWPERVADDVARLRAAGVTPVLAHPERNDEVQLRPSRLGELVRNGALVQLTAGSVDGTLGAAPRRAAFELVRSGLCAPRRQ